MKKILFALTAITLAASAFADDLALPLQPELQATITDAAFDPNDPELQVLGKEQLDIWERIRRGFAIPDLESPLVVNHTVWYVSRPDYIHRTTTRASRYLYHVVEELEKRNMPTELALLPFIESAFNPNAYSTAKAAGMWQFVPATGLDFNLKQSVFKDERRNILASTDAALNYLQKLHNMFGDWQLALAAYNWGEGSVRRAISKNKAAGLPTDYSSLHMPGETRNYVPKLQAVKNIIATPDQYNIALPKVDNQPYFVTIGKTRDMDIKVAAQLAELSLDDFKALNPQFNRPVIIGSSDTKILLPQSNAEKFKTNLAKWGRTLSSWTSHTVTTAREKIETIAKRFGTTPAVIREVNQIPPRMQLRAGSTILVPKNEQAPDRDIAPSLADNAKIMMVPEGAGIRRVSVRVGKRDSLASIAKRHKVSVDQIKSWNNLRNEKVAAGQTLKLEVAARSSSRKRVKSAKPVRQAKAKTIRSVQRAKAPATASKPVRRKQS
jgi:membrane-bound lytic murein transglycosylase D